MMVIAGGVIPPQDYDFLHKAGVKLVFGPGLSCVLCHASTTCHVSDRPCTPLMLCRHPHPRCCRRAPARGKAGMAGRLSHCQANAITAMGTRHKKAPRQPMMDAR